MKRELSTSSLVTYITVIPGYSIVTSLPYETTTSQRYEQTMARLQRITGAGYTVEVVWECQIDKDILLRHPELKHRPILQHAPLNTRDFLYGGRTEAMVLH